MHKEEHINSSFIMLPGQWLKALYPLSRTCRITLTGQQSTFITIPVPLIIYYQLSSHFEFKHFLDQ